ncbi:MULTISPECIES: hypothetical protein [Rhodococcus]|uniref:Core-binding (CB) domain-containing protein n=2 Tax=Rhodococcus opacus TaxID=37919 RepID=C1BD09_RHOOB|nr:MULTISPECIES: hypothetical protein [Rhodococcus]EID81329.1 hypothetical protein W59_03581 [Rhodococcus opacus RKJ300 = JCM 13270]QQZ19237.1 hypothetical protein GO592_38050 [Rhodococcus sp. 21391]BAH55753.1 hypothetical protein ROP_pROB01-02540 [Rhodococcus opacus B4]
MKLKARRRGGLSVVRDLREVRAAVGPEDTERFETDVFAGFVLARCAAGLSDNMIRSDVSHLEQVRTWFGKPLWDMLPADADSYFGTVLRPVLIPTRLARAQALKTYFEFLELRHKIEIHNLTGRIAPPGRPVRTRRDHSDPILHSRATDPPNPSRGTRSTELSTNPRINSPQIH